jgi:hypothetical protein
MLKRLLAGSKALLKTPLSPILRFTRAYASKANIPLSLRMCFSRPIAIRVLSLPVTTRIRRWGSRNRAELLTERIRCL